MEQGPEQQDVTDTPLPPHLQPIADRYGRDLFDAALRIAALTSGLDYLLGRTRSIPALVHFHRVVDSIAKGLADLNNELIAAKGWHLTDVVECIGEIGKAQREDAPRIVVPN